MDRALVAYIIAQGAGAAASVLPGKAGGDIPLPCAVCYTHRASPIRNTASYTCQASIECRSTPNDASSTVSDAFTGGVFDAFFTIDDDSGWDSKKVAAQITAAARAAALADPDANADLADFTCLDVRHGDEEGSFDGDVWTETLNLELDAAPADVS